MNRVLAEVGRLFSLDGERAHHGTGLEKSGGKWKMKGVCRVNVVPLRVFQEALWGSGEAGVAPSSGKAKRDRGLGDKSLSSLTFCHDSSGKGPGLFLTWFMKVPYI